MLPFSLSRPDHHIAARAVPGILLVLMLAACTMTFISSNPAHAALTPPTVTGRVLTNPSSLISIQGDGFSPGGRVQVFATDYLGNALHAPVSTMAAPGAPFGDYGTYSGVTGYGNPGTINLVLDLGDQAIFGLNGSQDPANGYDAGADLSVQKFASSIQIRAFDEEADTWSSFAVVDLGESVRFNPGYSGGHHVPRPCVAFIPCGQP